MTRYPSTVRYTYNDAIDAAKAAVMYAAEEAHNDACMAMAVTLMQRLEDLKRHTRKRRPET